MANCWIVQQISILQNIKKTIIMKTPKTKSAKQAKVAKVMGEYKSGTLHAGRDPKGPRKAPVVKSRKQAVAIAMSQAGMSKKRK